MEIEHYEIEVEPDGFVTDAGHEAADDGDAFCTFHNPSVSPLVFAPIYYSAAIGLARECPHGALHPDYDDHRAQKAASPVFAEVVEHLHDLRCDGCCIDKEPLEKNDDPGSHRADTSQIPQATPAVVPTEEGEGVSFLPEVGGYFHDARPEEDIRRDPVGNR